MAKKRRKTTSKRVQGRSKPKGSRPSQKKAASKRMAKRRRRKSAALRPKSRRAATLAWDSDAMTAAIDAVWDQPDSSHMTNCANFVTRPNRDCNCFLKNAARGFFASTQAFDDATKIADDIIGILADASNGWTEIANPDGNGAQRTADAISAFNSDNKVVIAGMTSDELGDTNGHLALVVSGTETAGTANLVVPKCTAGSKNDTARVRDKGVNWSFGATMPRRVRYFYRVPDTSPLTSIRKRARVTSKKSGRTRAQRRK